MVSPAVDALIAEASERAAFLSFEGPVMDLWEQLRTRPVADETARAEFGSAHVTPRFF